MNNWLNIEENRKRAIIESIATETRLSTHAIEKDWWVTMSLKALFSCECANHIVFKGGTSLSKGWNLIERFSYPK